MRRTINIRRGFPLTKLEETLLEMILLAPRDRGLYAYEVAQMTEGGLEGKTLPHALRRMHARGWVSLDVGPGTGPGSPRHYYLITDAGIEVVHAQRSKLREYKAAVTRWLGVSEEDDEEYRQ